MLETKHRPDPHALDFDWRFTDKTVNHLITLIGKTRALLLGVPSLALGLSIRDQDYVLIDRQPPESIGRVSHIQADVRFTTPQLGSFETVVIDAPWYVEDLERWLKIGLQHLQPNGRLIFSLWPSDTRPDAEIERRKILDLASTFGKMFLNHAGLSYETPHFERASKSTRAVAEGQWRRGDLIVVEANVSSRENKLTGEINQTGYRWKRFVIGAYQIAVRLSDNVDRREPKLTRIGSDWVMPSVSRRWQFRDRIDLWTSDNRIAQLQNPQAFANAICKLRTNEMSEEETQAFALLKSHQFMPNLAGHMEIRKWTHLE